ncbi:MAG TPA: methyltransferase domain-containing protein [Anaeromyxobacter sp.]
MLSRQQIVSVLGKVVWAVRRLLIGKKLSWLGQNPASDSLAIIHLSVKGLGYEIARERAPGLRGKGPATEPAHHSLRCKATTQRDIESPWFAHWCAELKITPIYYRKLWEYAFALQALFEHGRIREGMRGLGFGCGEESIASYLAGRGARITVTDLDPGISRGRGWIERGYHTTELDKAFKPELVSRRDFDERVHLEYVDMNAIPKHLDGAYDFCWSICAFEHLGSAENGLRFVENAMATLRPGGVAVHTTEFNFLTEHETIENRDIVLYLRKHFIDLKQRLERAGHSVPDLDFDTGDGVLDRFIDVPPYGWQPDWREDVWGRWGQDAANLKMSIGSVATTCFGIIVKKRE